MPHSFVAEQLYNMSIATIAPHCAICIILTKVTVDESWIKDYKKVRIPESSDVLISTITYVAKLMVENQHLTKYEFNNRTSNLLTCFQCKITVHAGKI